MRAGGYRAGLSLSRRMVDTPREGTLEGRGGLWACSPWTWGVFETPCELPCGPWAGCWHSEESCRLEQQLELGGGSGVGGVGGEGCWPWSHPREW